MVIEIMRIGVLTHQHFAFSRITRYLRYDDFIIGRLWGASMTDIMIKSTRENKNFVQEKS